jgi:hypothetical protein
MKVPLITIALICAALTTGCGSISPFKSTDDNTISSPTPSVKKDQTIAAEGSVPNAKTIDIPAWYIKAPASTDEYVFVTGTGISSNLSMSRTKAMLDAQVQLASKINGAIDAAVRQSRKDSDSDMNEDYTSLTVRKRIIDTSIAGHHLEDSRVVAENKGYRTFVLVRYPLGRANQFLKSVTPEVPRNMDAEIDREFAPTPTSQLPEGAQPIPVRQVNSIQLLDVDNEEYRRRRDEALVKPGAVVGRITLQ